MENLKDFIVEYLTLMPDAKINVLGVSIKDAADGVKEVKIACECRLKDGNVWKFNVPPQGYVPGSGKEPIFMYGLRLFISGGQTVLDFSNIATYEKVDKNTGEILEKEHKVEPEAVA